MTTIQDMTTGQRFTNGTTSVQWEVIDADKHAVKNLETGKAKTIAIDTHCYLIEITIETVVDYNSKQDSMCMLFLNKDGSEKKKGFVAIYDDRNKFCKTLKQAESVTTQDFIIEKPIYWNDAGMSNVEYINQ